MAVVHKISGDFFEDSFTLIALHSSLEDYAMVYAINLRIKSVFKRAKTDLNLKGQTSFPIFEWQDGSTDRYWSLMANSSTVEERFEGLDLFQDEPSFTTVHLINEYKEVDYFIKIEHDDDLDEAALIRSLLKIPKLITAYIVDADNLKSKNNLIF